MKIIFIGPRSIPAKYGGIDTHTEKVADYLANEIGYEIVVYARKFYSDVQEDFYKGIRVRKMPTFTNKYLDTIAYSLMATFCAIFEGADIIHYQGASAAFSFVPYFCGRKVVCTAQAIEWQRAKWGPFIKFFLKLTETLSFRYSHNFITVSRMLESYFNKKYPHNKKVTFIPNGFESIPSLPAKEMLKYGITADSYIFSAGRLVPEKGLHYLIQAYNKIGCCKKLVIAGDTLHQDAYAVNLKKMANENIIFLGFISGDLLTELYSNAYMYVHPSELEGMSMSILEAMSFGKCVLASDIPENREAIDEYGFYFNNKNVEDLAGKINFLINNKDMVRETGEKAKKYVIQNFQWEKICSQLNDIYKDLYKGK